MVQLKVQLNTAARRMQYSWTEAQNDEKQPPTYLALP
jgi:hypothetical protein